jgi:plasmid stability protein
MANLTIAIDDDLLRRARIRALEAGTSVNALLRDYLESYAGSDAMAKRRAIAATADALNYRSTGGHNWTRDDLHDRQ